MKISFQDLIPDDELAKTLVDDLRKPREIVNKFIVNLYRQKRLNVKINSELGDSTTQINTDSKLKKPIYIIEIGTNSKLFGIIERKYFDADLFNNKELLEYKLLQQICSCIYNELLFKNNSYLKSLATLASNQNAIDKRFFTLNGSFNVSLNQENLEKQDVAELLAMYLWDSNYFNKYMRFSIDDSEHALYYKKQFAIRTLNVTNVTIIEEMIKNIIKTI